MQSLIAIMRAQRHHGYIDFRVVDFVDHAILLVDAAAPSLFKLEVAQVLHLPSTCARMFLQLNQQLGNFVQGLFVAAALDGRQLCLRLLGKKYSVCHGLERIDERQDIFFALQSRKLSIRVVSLTDVLLNGLHIAAVSKEFIARRTHLIGVCIMRWLQQLAGQPTTVALRERQALNICPKFVSCYSCHNDNNCYFAAKISINIESTK